MDSGNIIAIGAALLLTSIPLFIEKYKKGELLFHTILNLGKRQISYARAASSDTLPELLKIEPGAKIKVITNNFRKDKWGENTKWNDFIKKNIKNNQIQITAYSKYIKKSTLDDSINEMIKNNTLKIVQIRNLPKEHLLTVNIKNQLWYEKRHRGYYAFNCTYTDSPHKEVWKEANTVFEKLDKTGEKYVLQ